MNTLMNISFPLFRILILPVMVLSACVPISTHEGLPLTPDITDPTSERKQVLPEHEKPTPDPTNVRVDDPNDYNYPELLPFDTIRPIYEPRFSQADQSPLNEDELVIGVAFDGEAKAYPITVLRIREMVNDELADWPILVTW